jgi:DNA-binding transcriptional LysR family regulator
VASLIVGLPSVQSNDVMSFINDIDTAGYHANVLLRQIEGFLETARHRNLSRTAEALHVTQPALTARIQALERELGTALFVRGRFGMDMTDAGRAFLPYAERALAALDSGANLLTELRRGGTGELVLGAAPAVSTYVLPGLLVRFTRRYPKVRLVVRTGHSEEILDMALRREVDLGLVRELQHPDVEIHPLYDDELVLVAAGSHRFGGRGVVGLHELAEARLILFDRTSSYYELTNAFFREAGVAPSGVIELDNIDAAKQMVGQGLGIALLPQTSVAAELADGRLRAIDIEGAAPIRRRIVAIRRRDIGPATGPVGAFLEVLGEVDAVLPAIARRGDEIGDRRGRPPGEVRD